MVGQVQYACVSYFCTMTHRPVGTPVKSMNPKARSCEDLCSCSRRITLRHYGLRLVENNCIKVVDSKKSVVTSFTDSAKLISHFVTVLGFIPSLNGHQSAIRCLLPTMLPLLHQVYTSSTVTSAFNQLFDFPVI